MFEGLVRFFSPDGRLRRGFPDRRDGGRQGQRPGWSTTSVFGTLLRVPRRGADIGWTPDGHLLMLAGDTVRVYEAMSGDCTVRRLRRLGRASGRRRPMVEDRPYSMFAAACDNPGAMETRVASPVLWVRALFAGSFAFFLGIAGPRDGRRPAARARRSWWCSTPSPSLLSLPLLARPASRLRMLALLVGGQTFIHLCLTLTAGHAVTRGARGGRAARRRPRPAAGRRRAPGRLVPGRLRRAPTPSRRPRRRCRSTTSSRTCRRTRR